MNSARIIRFSFYMLFLFFATVATIDDCVAQKRYESKARKLNKWRYKNAIIKPGALCKEIKRNKKRGYRPKPHIVVHKQQTYAEGGAPSFNPYNNDPKKSAIEINIERNIPKPLSEMTLDEKHHLEDDVLKENNLPEPTSEKHEQIRREVEKHLANFENEKPIKLEPLYFVLDQDEFAFVDMDPFLVAVEYALQGKHLLIEGHTDASGSSQYNVDLSIKRVERIRQLMIDMGVSDDHISVVGYGEEHAEVNDEIANDKQLDRRVDFTVF